MGSKLLYLAFPRKCEPDKRMAKIERRRRKCHSPDSCLDSTQFANTPDKRGKQLSPRRRGGNSASFREEKKNKFSVFVHES